MECQTRGASCGLYKLTSVCKSRPTILQQLLMFIRDQKVPADLVDVFDDARIPFFEGRKKRRKKNLVPVGRILNLGFLCDTACFKDVSLWRCTTIARLKTQRLPLCHRHI